MGFSQNAACLPEHFPPHTFPVSSMLPHIFCRRPAEISRHNNMQSAISQAAPHTIPLPAVLRIFHRSTHTTTGSDNPPSPQYQVPESATGFPRHYRTHKWQHQQIQQHRIDWDLIENHNCTGNVNKMTPTLAAKPPLTADTIRRISSYATLRQPSRYLFLS